MQKLQGKGATFGVVRAIQKHWQCSVASSFAAKWIIQSPITSCSRRDHSVCRTSANSIRTIYVHRRCGLSAAKEVLGGHSKGEVWYLRLPCSSCGVPPRLCVCRYLCALKWSMRPRVRVVIKTSSERLENWKFRASPVVDVVARSWLP